jgi:hypothetical protein
LIDHLLCQIGRNAVLRHYVAHRAPPTITLPIGLLPLFEMRCAPIGFGRNNRLP